MPNASAYGLSPALRVTGKISRLVNCLAGYDDLVVVEIADKEQIGMVIEIVRNRLGTNYTVEEHKRISILELAERESRSNRRMGWIYRIKLWSKEQLKSVMKKLFKFFKQM